MQKMTAEAKAFAAATIKSGLAGPDGMDYLKQHGISEAMARAATASKPLRSRLVDAFMADDKRRYAAAENMIKAQISAIEVKPGEADRALSVIGAYIAEVANENDESGPADGPMGPY